MIVLARLTLFIILLCGAVLCAPGQAAQTTGTGTITGRITIGDKAAQGVTVVLLSGNPYGPDRKPQARSTTDAEGQFRLSNVPAGRHQVVPIAPAFIAPGTTTDYGNQGKRVNLAEGETIDKVDFTLVRGGVITGRVTDADGRPVIGEQPQLTLADQSAEQRRPFFFNQRNFETDDRGVYRIYGVPPGRYKLSVGVDSKEGTVRIGFGRGGFFARTFHPGVTEEAKATIIEVAEGSEATNVDIALGRRSETYAVSGRVIEAESGKPVSNIAVGYGSLTPEGKQMQGFGFGNRTDADGNFRFDGLAPGRYAAFAANFDQQTDNYNVPVTFEINEGDATGLVIKLRRGASISGMVVIEGSGDRAALAGISQLRIVAYQESEELSAPSYGQGKLVGADGSFQISGLSPGKVRLMLGGWPPPKGYSLLRVERDGVEQRAGIMEVAAGSQITGVRIVMEHGTGVVRGQVRVENGELPEGSRLYVSARRPSQSEPSLPGAEVDSRGRFVMEGLPPGEYQLRMAGRLGTGGQRLPPVTQTVNVTNGAETEVTLTLNLNAKDETPRP
ncbi:MAG TPA: carboxypeptidase-like regulatory domain-containing protein [Pyrinomonadaceae bacterium]